MSADVDVRAPVTIDLFVATEFPGIWELTQWQLRSTVESVGLRGADHGFAGTIKVPNEDDSFVFILFHDGFPWVFTDGPKRNDWPHRHGQVALCMWYEGDPVNRRWVPEDGLADLLFRIRNHLLREAHWVRTGVWLGPEAPHG